MVLFVIVVLTFYYEVKSFPRSPSADSPYISLPLMGCVYTVKSVVRNDMVGLSQSQFTPILDIITLKLKQHILILTVKLAEGCSSETFTL